MGAKLAFEESLQFLKAGIEECTERIHPSAWKKNSAKLAKEVGRNRPVGGCAACLGSLVWNKRSGRGA
jgi:hypothetical protein